MNDDDDSEFARLIPGVKRLRQDRINVYQQPGRKVQQPGAKLNPTANLQQTGFVDESIAARDTHFNAGLQKKLQRRIKQGLIRLESSIDLHGYRQTEALEALEAFLTDALQRRHRMLLIIHGQGYRSQSDAVLKPLVQRWLANQSQVLAWCPALPRDGAAGASYVYLRSS